MVSRRWLDRDSKTGALKQQPRLGLTAFRIVLARKSTAYKPLLKLLDFELSQGRLRRHKKQFRVLVNSGIVVIDQLSF